MVATDPHITLAVQSARFVRVSERPMLTDALTATLDAYGRPASDAPGLVGAISFAVEHGVVTVAQVCQFITTIALLAAPHDTPIEAMLTDYAQLRRQGFDAEAATAYLAARFEGDAG